MASAGAEEESATREIRVPAGKHGEFLAYLPARTTSGKPCPLVVSFHGHGGTAERFLSVLKPVADREGLAVLAVAVRAAGRTAAS